VLFILLEYVSCGNPGQQLSNGMFSYTTDSAGSYARLVCSRPFVETSGVYYRCAESGEWTGSGYCSKWIIYI